ncbi:unnamed protein product [Allacma fusca]|uniref:Doublecortin domain-containing protein n=1 Tax=Allacma fusca TaxID=39272 RepID=A0A8J2PJL3_9HEXA|nr:unnamed protein product [Allacma fusca]
MQFLAEDSSPEIPARRSLSDPTIKPRETHRVGTPYPIAKKQPLPSRIPRLATGIHHYSTTGISRNRFSLRRAIPPSGSKPDFFPNQCVPSVTTIFHPRELVVTPFPDQSQEFCDTPISPPVVQLYRQSSRARKHLFKAQQSFHYQNKAPSRGFESKARANLATPSPTLTQNHSINFPVRHQKVLDSEGYLQGPHSTHNRRIELYGRPITDNQSENDHDHGDCLSSKGRPPLPPNVFKSCAQTKPRLATATLSQGNTILEQHPSTACSNTFCQSRASSRSGLYSPQYSQYSPKQQSPRVNPPLVGSPSSTSVLSKVHEVESCTNLLSKKPVLTPDSSVKCPLCSTKGTCHLHHRTMCSRYMTDLEWRICHAVNIYVYKNGEEGQTPVLIHIPPSKKKNMRCVMSVIQERICYPIGYAKYLYRMNGKKITTPCELEMYNNYVVASNYDKCFKCVCYSRRKSPLLVLAKESKHVRELRLKNYQYELYLARKRCGEERLACDGEYCGQQDFYGPTPPVANPAAQIGAGFRTQGPIMPSKCPPKRKKCADCECAPGSTILMYPNMEPYEYTINTCTISTAPLKDPEMLKKSNDSDDIMTPSGRYKSINDDDSLFYSAKKKKLNRGVIDVSGEKKKFFYSETDRQSIGESDAEEIHKRKYNPVYSTEEVSESEVPGNKFNKSIKTVRLEQAAPMSKDSHLLKNVNSIPFHPTESNGKGDANSPIPMELPRNLLSEVMEPPGTPAVESESAIVEDESRPMTESLQNESTQSIVVDGPIVSAPSRSYTILGTVGDGSAENQQSSQINRQIVSQTSTLPSTSYHQKPSESSIIKSEGMASPSRLSYKDTNNNIIANVKSSRKVNPEMSQFQPDVNLYTVGASPSIYLARNQPYPCYGPGPGNYYVQQTSSPKYSQAQLQQIYPMEVLNQRQPYGSIVVDGNARYSSSCGNCYSTDEVDIPFSPLYQRSLVEPLTPYVQVPPPYITTTSNNQQFSYHRTDVPSYTTSRNMGLVAIRKPSRRNVAIQMGEPSSLESQVTLHPYDSSQGLTSTSPRLSQQQIFYQTPNYFYHSSPGNPPGSNNVVTPKPPVPISQPETPVQQDHQRQQSSQRSSHQHQTNQQHNQDVNDSVLPPPTGYRDGLYEHRSGRAFAKHSSRSGRHEEKINNKENNEYLQLQDTRQSRTWK